MTLRSSSLAALLFATANAWAQQATPSVTLTTPAAGATQISGQAYNIDPSRIKVVVYVLTNQWYVQPLAAAPFTNISANGSWTTTVNPWSRIAVLLVNPAGYTPAAVEITDPVLDPGVIAWTQYPSGPVSVMFSGLTWGIKLTGDSSPGDQFQPGPNYWSNDPSLVNVQADGLHLKAGQVDGLWQCAEVYLLQSLGYGTYTVHISSRLDQLDLNTVAAPLFIYAGPNQELDNEYSGAGGLVHAPYNAQFVVQPYVIPDNIVFYVQPSTAQFTSQMDWTAGQVTFITWNGWSQVPAPGDIIYRWTYVGPYIPVAGQERVHINTWLLNGNAPVSGAANEMVVNSFSFVPATGSGTVPVTIQTNPSGLQFSVDGGTAQTAPATVNLPQGPHTIAVTSPQAGAAGTQFVFSSWNDSGAASHIVTVGSSPATYTANFTTQYLLTTSVTPSGAGTVTANPSGTYFNAGTNVQLTAAPASGYQFSSWSGDLNGAANPQSLTMDGPHSVVANFSASAGSCSIGLPPSVTLPPTGTSTQEPCPNGPGQPDCGVLPEIPGSLTVTPGTGCGPWTATSSNPEFLQITGSSTGTGPGSVSYVLLNNTHNLPRNYTITVTAGAASSSYTVTESGSGDGQVYREVYALYEQLLGRDPDAGGFAFWTGVGGAGLGQMADSFLTSPEAFDSDFAVMAVYQATINAPPTFVQYAAAVAGLRSGAQTLTGLFNSLAAAGFNAANLYQNLLNRQPTSSETTGATNAGLANWFQTLIGYPGTAAPVSAPNNEFQSTGTFHTDHTNTLYTRLVYYVTVSRDPDPDGFNFWLGVANSGGPGLLFQGNPGYPIRIQILGPGTPNQGFIGSPEFQGLFQN